MDNAVISFHSENTHIFHYLPT